MQISVLKAFVTDGFLQDVSFTEYHSDVCLPFCYGKVTEPVIVSGKLFNRAGILRLELELSYSINGKCARCCEPVLVNCSTTINVILVREKQFEDDDDLVQVNGDTFDPNELIDEAIILNTPSQILCNEDCKGICSMCGINLNEKKCNCSSEQ